MLSAAPHIVFLPMDIIILNRDLSNMEIYLTMVFPCVSSIREFNAIGKSGENAQVILNFHQYLLAHDSLHQSTSKHFLNAKRTKEKKRKKNPHEYAPVLLLLTPNTPPFVFPWDSPIIIS